MDKRFCKRCNECSQLCKNRKGLEDLIARCTCFKPKADCVPTNMNNIFENAKFGDKFRTRDGRMMLYLRKMPDNSDFHEFLDCYINIERFHSNGQYCERYPLPCDIVSEWKEERQVVCWDKLTEDEKSEVMLDIVSTRKPIDEEKLSKILDEAEKLRETAVGRKETGGWCWRKWVEWGYRKAKEG